MNPVIKEVKELFETYKALDKVKALDSSDKANSFLGLLLTKKDCLGLESQSIKGILEYKFESDNYKRKLIENLDLFLEDADKVSKGEFYTPSKLVQFIHEKMIPEVYGEDWKEEYIVWDCASGVGNLTNYYNFKELYSSTLEQSDIDTQELINEKSSVGKGKRFAFDFLNQDLIDLPLELYAAIKAKKKIMFLINPPYGMFSNRGSARTKTNTIKGLTKTKQYERMKNDVYYWGKNSEDLMLQFLSRIIMLKRDHNENIELVMVGKSTLLLGHSNENFRVNLNKANLNLKQDEKSLLAFKSTFFANIKSSWMANVFCFKNCEQEFTGKYIAYIPNQETKKEFASDKELEFAGETLILENKDCIKNRKYFKTYLVEKNKSKETEYKLILNATSGLVFTDKLKKVKEDCMSTLYLCGNSVEEGTVAGCIMNSGIHTGNGVAILKDKECVYSAALTVAACKSIKVSWKNFKLQKLEPVYNGLTEEVKTMNADLLIYSLFNTASEQTSARSIKAHTKEGKEVVLDQTNEWFWIEKDKVKKVAEKVCFKELLEDINKDEDKEERFIQQILKEDLKYASTQAKELLDEATNFILDEDLMLERKKLNKDRPDLFLYCWDAGYKQAINKLMKGNENESIKLKFKEFRDKYNKFSSEVIRKYIYDLDIVPTLECGYKYKS